MKTKNAAKILMISLIILETLGAKAQSNLTGYFETGNNVVSDALFLKTAGLAEVQFGKNKFGAGIEFDLISNTKKGLTGYNLIVSRNFLIGELLIEAQGFYLLKSFSKIYRETNLGVLLSINFKHVSLNGGADFKTFGMSRAGKKIFESGSGNKIREPWNLLYSVSYTLNNEDKPWNIEISIDDYNDFIISQENNPILNLTGSYSIRPSVSLFIRSSYKSAGMMNTNINYFGFYFKTGIVWNF